MRLFLILSFVFLGTSTKQLVVEFVPINKAESNLKAFFPELASLKRFIFVKIIKNEFISSWKTIVLNFKLFIT